MAMKKKADPSANETANRPPSAGERKKYGMAPMPPQRVYKKGGGVKKYARGGGVEVRGKTRGKIV